MRNNSLPGSRWRWRLFVLSFFPPDVLDKIWDKIESVSEGFSTYLCKCIRYPMHGLVILAKVLYTLKRLSCLLIVVSSRFWENRERERESPSLSHSLCMLYTHTQRETHTLSLILSVCCTETERERHRHTLSRSVCVLFTERERERKRDTHTLSLPLSV